MNSQGQTSVKKKRGRPKIVSMDKCKTCADGIQRGREREHFCNVHCCSKVELYAILRLAGWSKESVGQCMKGRKTQSLHRVKFAEHYWMHVSKDADGNRPDHRPVSAEHYEQYKQYLSEGIKVLKLTRKWNNDTASQAVVTRLNIADVVVEQAPALASPSASAIASVTVDSTSNVDGSHSSDGTISNSTRSRPFRFTRKQVDYSSQLSKHRYGRNSSTHRVSHSTLSSAQQANTHHSSTEPAPPLSKRRRTIASTVNRVQAEPSTAHSPSNNPSDDTNVVL